MDTLLATNILLVVLVCFFAVGVIIAGYILWWIGKFIRNMHRLSDVAVWQSLKVSKDIDRIRKKIKNISFREYIMLVINMFNKNQK